MPPAASALASVGSGARPSGSGKSSTETRTPLRGRPLEQLGAIEAVLLVDAVDREPSLLDPAVDRLLRNAEQRRGVPNRDLDPHHALSDRELRRRVA